MNRSSHRVSFDKDKKKTPPKLAVFFFGGPEEIRTPDPHNANVMRSQLRYRPKSIIYYTQPAWKSKVFFAYSPENAGG